MEEKSLEDFKSEVEEAVKFQEGLHTTIDEEADQKTVTQFKNQTLMQIQQNFTKGEVDADEGIKQVVNVLTIVEATADPKLREDLKKDAKKSMRSYMKGLTYKDEENKIAHRQKRNEAFYKAFRPILEFDLSHLIGKRRKRIVERDKATGKKIVKYEDVEQEPQKTYKDRSYGLMLMLTMIGLFIIPYCVANVILACGRLINSMFECFAQFGRTAFWLCTSIAGIGIIGLVVYVLLLVIQSAFGVQIFG